MAINKKKNIKKLIKIVAIVLVILALVNFVCPSKSDAKVSNDIIDACTKVVSTILDGIIGLLFWPFRLLILLMGKGIELIFSFVVDGSDKVTVEGILFNKIEIISVDFMNIDGATRTATRILRENVAAWYTGVRNLSAAILVVICIYTGIRMALATASDKAKYKEMLINWISSVALLFVLHYVIAGVIIVNNVVVDAIGKGISAGDGSSALNKLSDSFFKEALWTLGFAESTAYTICYLVLVFMTFTFLIMYVKRLITLAFLIIIAPLVTITYSIDKMGDGKAQGLNNWFKEFAYNIIIQPFHCIAYASLGGMAITLASADDAGLAEGVACVVIIAFIIKSEKILKTIFHIQSDSMMDALSSAAIATNISNRAMQFGKQVTGTVKQGIKANRANAEEIRKVKDEIKIAKGKTTREAVDAKNAKRLEKQNARAKRKADFEKAHPKISGFSRDLLAFTGDANATLFNGVTAFSMGLAQGDENAAIMGGLRQAEATHKERKKQSQEFKKSQLQHSMATAYNNYRESEVTKITEKFKADPKFLKMNEKDQAELIEKTFDRKVQDLLNKGTMTSINEDSDESKLVHAMDNLQRELQAQGLSGDNAMSQVKGTIAKIASGEIGETPDNNISFNIGQRTIDLPVGTIADYEFGDRDVGGHITNREVIDEKLRTIPANAPEPEPAPKQTKGPGPAKGARTTQENGQPRKIKQPTKQQRPQRQIKANKNFTNSGPRNSDRRLGNGYNGNRRKR